MAPERRLASLPMYLQAGTLLAPTRVLWGAIADALEARGVAGVPRGDFEPSADVWTDPALLLSQTCGYVLTHRLRGVVRLVATPRYRAPGCVGAGYVSFIVVARDAPFATLADLGGRTAGVNQLESHSGMNALRHAVAPLARDGRFFGRVVVTGAHVHSLEQLAAGAVDVAAIDAVVVALLAREAPALIAATRVIGETPRVPGLPYVTRARATDAEVAVLADALHEVMADPRPALVAARAALLLDGIDVLPAGAYDALDALEADAIARGYPTVA